MKKAIVISGALAMPFVVSAQQIVVILSRFRQILDLLIPIFITLAVLFFFWGLIMYIKAGGGTEQKRYGQVLYDLGGHRPFRDGFHIRHYRIDRQHL